MYGTAGTSSIRTSWVSVSYFGSSSIVDGVLPSEPITIASPCEPDAHASWTTAYSSTPICYSGTSSGRSYLSSLWVSLIVTLVSLKFMVLPLLVNYLTHASFLYRWRQLDGVARTIHGGQTEPLVRTASFRIFHAAGNLPGQSNRSNHTRSYLAEALLCTSAIVCCGVFLRQLCL